MYSVSVVNLVGFVLAQIRMTVNVDSTCRLADMRNE